MKKPEIARYCLYFPDDGQYTRLMTYMEAMAIRRDFINAYLVDARTGEVID